MSMWGDEATIEVAAPPEVVWSLVSDIPRMGEWSPVCHRCEWLDGADVAAVGARFVGHNKANGARWSRECTITAAEPGRELAFSTYFRGEESTRWRYRFEPSDGGTRVVEAYEVVSVPRWIKVLRMLPGLPAKSLRDGRAGMTATLQRLKVEAEASVALG
ncbi:MAG: SRPBCC family protein [Acidimicrobiales bacterium]